MLFYVEDGFLNVQAAKIHVKKAIPDDFDLLSQQAASLMFQLHAELLFRRSRGETGLWRL